MSQIFKCESRNFRSMKENICVEEKHLSHSQILHWHDFYELEYFLEGNGVYCINGEIYEIQPGMLLFTTPGDLQQITFSGPVHLLNISFTTAMLDPVLQNKLMEPTMLLDQDRFYECIFREMLGNIYSSGKFSLQYLQALLNTVLFRLYHALGCPDEELPIANSCVMEIVAYINRHFEEDLSLEVLAKRGNLSKEYLSSLFHKTMHMTISEYIISLRLRHARTLLLLTQSEIREIQVKTGFHSASHFARSFQKKYHCSPSDFRKKQFG